MEQELAPLSPLECEKIIGVLKRDRELRAVEEARIRHLKQELICLRKRSALKPGIDPARVCARCLSELGRIINRGALCPLCHKKVCKSCRQYGDKDHEWICIYCFKQMQLKAISGEWMHEFNRLSVRRRAKDPPGDQVRRVLHESQRKELLELKTSPESPFELPPPKPPRLPQCDMPHSSQQKAEEGKKVRNLNHEETSESTTSEVNVPVIETNQEKEDQTESLPNSSSPSANRTPNVLPRVNPWSGIEPEPTIPVRLTRLVTVGSVPQHDQWEPLTLKERHPADEGQYIMHSLSTSSEVTEEMEHYHPSMPLPRKRLSPLKKQQAIPEPNQIDRQQSSVDSGVFSPGPKQDHITEVSTVPSSPLLLTRFSSVGHESEHCVQHLMSESSPSETDEERHQNNRKSRIVFRKVTMKKKKSVSGTRSLEERHSCTSADESGNSLRSSPHGRLRMRNRSLSGGSEDERQRKGSVPQIAVSECSEQNHQIGRSSAASSEKDSSGVQEDDLDQVFAYHSRSQMSLSSFGGRSESVTSVYSAAGGGRYGTVAVTGEVLFCISYNYKTGTLEINIKECRNLAPVETKRNRSDPYVKIYLLPDRTKSGKRKTKVKKHTLSPVFDELLKFQVTISELETRTLWLSVWHSDRFGRNDFLGEVMLPLGYDAFESPGLKWYPLQERLETFDAPVSYKGDLILSLKYVPPDVTTRKVKKPGDQAKGSLHVLVREARNLMATRSNGTSDPFCKSYLLPDKSKSGKQKTSVFKKSCNPKWNHTFVYDELTVNDLRERCLELTIWDYDKITSNDFLGGVRLCLGTAKFQSREVDWMDSVGEEISLWYTMLERPNTWVDGSLLLRPSMQSRKPV